MSIDKIVVATDFSPASELAARQAMNVARHCGAEIVLVHAGTGPHEHEGLHGSQAELGRMAREAAHADRVTLEELRERLAGQGVDVSHTVVEGFADVSICEAADELGADLIVTGTHGRSGLKRFLLGSVAERVVRLAERSVLVARSDAGAGGFAKILVPIDFSDLSMHAIDRALEVAAPDAELELLHCWQLPTAGTTVRATRAVLEPMLEAISHDIDERGQTLARERARGGRRIRFRAIRRDPAHGIQERLEEDDFELVVMGSHGRRGIRRFLLGSVAEATLRHAACSVLIAHQGRS